MDSYGTLASPMAIAFPTTDLCSWDGCGYKKSQEECNQVQQFQQYLEVVICLETRSAVSHGSQSLISPDFSLGLALTEVNFSMHLFQMMAFLMRSKETVSSVNFCQWLWILQILLNLPNHPKTGHTLPSGSLPTPPILFLRLSPPLTFKVSQRAPLF